MPRRGYLFVAKVIPFFPNGWAHVELVMMK